MKIERGFHVQACNFRSQVIAFILFNIVIVYVPPGLTGAVTHSLTRTKSHSIRHMTLYVNTLLFPRSKGP
jgi:hypothetical protein